jgi:WD40 repeat protein
VLFAFIRIMAVTRQDVEATPSDQDRPWALVSRDEYKSPVWSLAFSPDDTHLAAATMAGDVWLKDFAGGQRNLIEGEAVGSAGSLAFSADARTLAVGGLGSAVRLLDLSSGEDVKALPADGMNNGRTVAISRDGRYLAAGGCEGTVTLWKWHLRQRLSEFTAHHGAIICLEFSPDGSALAAADSSGYVTIWDIASGNPRTVLRAHARGYGVTGLAFSPNGKLLATAGYLEFVVRLWDPRDGKLLCELSRSPFGVRALAFSPHGDLLAMAQADGSAILWGVEQRRELASVRANSMCLVSVAFSGNGRLLATGGTDGCLRTWDVGLALSGRPSNPARRK